MNPAPSALRRALRPGAAALLFLLPALLCAQALGRSFVSEDFLILRLLWERGGEIVTGSFTGPWLGITLVKFYRPVATALLALEAAAFGLDPLPYALTHLAVHGLGGVLLARFLERLAPAAGTVPAWGTALLFALYPLAPNAVLFVASFATLFAVVLGLGALLCFAGWRAGEGPARLSGAGALGLLSLASYEGLAVLPVLALAADVAIPVPAGGRPWRQRIAAHGAAFSALALYLLWRRHLFAQILGGYDETRARLLELSGERLAEIATACFRLIVPVYGPAPPSPPARAVALVLVLLMAAALVRRVRLRDDDDPSGPAWAGLTLLGGVWMLAAQAPFGFVLAVPANGRYWYLAAAGAALMLVAGAGVLAGPRRRGAALATTLVVASCWGTWLHRNAADYAEAGRQAAEIPRQLREWAAPGERLWLTRYPFFVTDAAGTPLAQVFRWGLHDAAAPPFLDPGLDVFPLPELAAGGLLPIAHSPYGGRILSWNRDGGRWVPFAETPALAAATAHIGALEALGPPDGASFDVGARAADPSWQILVPGSSHPSGTLFVVTAANAARIPLDVGAAGARAGLPVELLRAARQLYPGRDAFWWVEVRDGDGRLAAFCTLRRLELVDGPETRPAAGSVPGQLAGE